MVKGLSQQRVGDATTMVAAGTCISWTPLAQQVRVASVSSVYPSPRAAQALQLTAAPAAPPAGMRRECCADAWPLELRQTAKGGSTENLARPPCCAAPSPGPCLGLACVQLYAYAVRCQPSASLPITPPATAGVTYAHFPRFTPIPVTRTSKGEYVCGKVALGVRLGLTCWSAAALGGGLSFFM